MRLYLVRHGQSAGNVHFVPGVVRPKTDPLTEFGRGQGVNAAKYISSQTIKPTVVISSPYTRALDTAKIIQKVLGIPIHQDDRLGEYNPGDWDGVHFEEMAKRFSKLAPEERYTYRPPHGESWLDEANRMEQVIVEEEAKDFTRIVLVSHYDPIKALINLLTEQSPSAWGEPIEYPPGSVTTLDKKAGTWVLL